MSILARGQRCVIVGGCPENIGLVVEVIHRIGRHLDREDAYLIRTVSGRPFHQLWMGQELQRGASSEAITDRHKLRPLVDPKDDSTDQQSTENQIKEAEAQHSSMQDGLADLISWGDLFQIATPAVLAMSLKRR